MGHCCSKDASVVQNDDITAGNSTVGNHYKSPSSPLPAVPPGETPSSEFNCYAASSFQSPLPAGVAPSPSPAGALGRKFRWPLPPPSPAKPIMAIMRRRGHAKPPKGGPIPEDGEGAEGERKLDKSFGYAKNFPAKFELGKEVGRGHFGHTCWAKGKKGELKGQSVAVKIISKAKIV